LACAAAALGVTAIAEPALAQANEQFLPALVYRTGPYAPNGIPFADGVTDYWTLLNERDGGINGVKIASEECETGYATDKGVECERLKGKADRAGYSRRSRPASLRAITEKVPGDKIRC
jgi:branched-chain amino acid transport system substrate-binding protein